MDAIASKPLPPTPGLDALIRAAKGDGAIVPTFCDDCPLAHSPKWGEHSKTFICGLLSPEEIAKRYPGETRVGENPICSKEQWIEIAERELASARFDQPLYEEMRDEIGVLWGLRLIQLQVKSESPPPSNP